MVTENEDGTIILDFHIDDMERFLKSIFQDNMDSEDINGRNKEFLLLSLNTQHLQIHTLVH